MSTTQQDDGWLPGSAGLSETPRQDRSRRTTKLVIDAAEELVGEVGPDQLTMSIISERSGVSIGGIYGRFDGKAGVLKAVRDRALHALETDLAQRYEIAPADVEEAVAILVETLASPTRRRLFAAPSEGVWDQRDILSIDRLRFMFIDAVAGRLPHDDPIEARATAGVAFRIVISTLSWHDLAPTHDTGSPLSLETVTRGLIRAVVAFLSTTPRDA